MSKYRKMQTKFISRQHLRTALQAVGITFEETKPGQETHLYGYHNDKRAETATFIIRRGQIGPFSNDLGWHWNGKGFEEIVSEYDSRHTGCTEIRKAVKREYAVASTMAQARSKGHRVQRQNQADGTVQLIVAGRI